MSRTPAHDKQAVLRKTLRETERGDECDGGWQSGSNVAVQLNDSVNALLFSCSCPYHSSDCVLRGRRERQGSGREGELESEALISFWSLNL